MTVEDAGALAAAVKVTVALQVGLHGLFEKADAVTPDGNVVGMLNVTGEVVPDVRAAVAVSTPPEPPSVIVRVDGEAARVRWGAVSTTQLNVVVWMMGG